MRLLVNHQLIPIPIQSESISWTNLLLKISLYCRNFTVFSLFFDVKKQRPKTNFETCYQCSVNIEISLELKVYVFLITCKINNLIALFSTNQITEISAPWWLFKTDMGLMNCRNAACMSCESEMLTEACLRNYRHGRRKSGE